MITSVRLKNFKNFADETLRLGPFTVIVGANASGKSNVRDAFRFLHGIGRGYTLADIVGGISGAGGRAEWEPIRGAANEIARVGESEFALEAMIDTSSRKAETEERLRLKGLQTTPVPTEVNYAIRVGCDAAREKGFSIKGVSLGADTGHSWERPEGWLEPWRQADGTILENQDLLPDMFPGYGRELSSLRYTIASTFRGIRFLDPVPNLMRQPSSLGQIVLGDKGENLPSVLHTICANKTRGAILTEWIRELTPMDIAGFGFPSDPSGRIHLMMVEEGGREVSAYSASDGTLRFLAMLAALLGPVPASLYFIEEIDTGLHPSRLHLLLDLIETQTAETGIQVVATTHSPTLLSMMSDRTFEDACVVCRLPDTTDAVIRPVSEIPKAAKLRKSQGLGRLLASGWMEDVLAFTEGGEGSG